MILSFILDLIFAGMFVYCFPRFFGLVSAADFNALKKSDRNNRWHAEDAEERADDYEQMLGESQALTQRVLMQLMKAHRDNATYRTAKSNPCHWENAARELERRIAAFQLQQQKIKKAYCEDVFRISHGQGSVAALRDPEKYLVELEDGSYMTAAELLRRAECIEMDAQKQILDVVAS